MKTIMIIGAGKVQVPLIEAAKRESYYTIACDWNPEAPGVLLADEFCRVSTKDRAGLYKNNRYPGPGSYNVPGNFDRGYKGKMTLN